ncbi:ParA family protein [Muribaculaceae bacterium Isolate-039 (Harlan)]|jgi:cellulose biosynthesis protein BcsQ|uniref:Conjugal transfer protein TraA n=4 Tax=Muribaculaceae TaxID=2005473 RepID=A0A2V1IWK7_9BACT|nr:MULTISPECIES: ParA family protein [Bacteroidales]ROS82084.1 ParA family protein [Muribaculaceae bacterium Isolate-042 (Harlan)]ROS83298.1 ParA family protein [Muribaculaceae bacterium Isolate-036 (Harlan)]ROS86225.1 ParA family protein [Muribaculaceae bacterium Isolate-039 (Harlan)]ROS88822.1 ParA family protein [Muribaculaceae bacterium Isolate-080 (Janvier)]ROS89498.1 ParA family protein [Muribaculaceae bacterium Isolate-043 (Harlan)]ROS93927.1 ParA family protein [Muribaculaceae bacteri
MKEPVFIAFSTQKGGAGKTTLTVLMASYLYYVRGLKVLVVDCDYPQYSIKEMRDRDVEILRINSAFKKNFMEQRERIQRDPYPILITKPEDALDRARAIIESGKEDYDIVLFDLPGTINNPGVAKTVSLMDYIFCPVAADKLILESSLAFAMKVRDEIMTVSGCSVKDMYMLWNLVDAREKTDLYERYEEVFEEQMLQTLKTRLPDAKKYRREGSKDAARAVFRSTLLPPDKNLLKGSRLVELADEILGIIKL